MNHIISSILEAEAKADEIISKSTEKAKAIILQGENDAENIKGEAITSLKEKRNEGLGSILLQYSFSQLEKRGVYYIFFMTTDEPGKRYYERNGFEVIRTFTEYRKKISE